MTTYRAPQRDMRFVLHELLEVERLSRLPGYEDATADVIDAVIEEGAKLCENVLFPINRAGDEEGCVYENGVVRTPPGLKAAYDRFVEGGWTALGADPAHGGQGLPKAIKLVVDEMVCSANLAFSTYPGLSASAYLAI
jgi:alkylation response protein AidB-like acyl-CoA dehydrogenase